MNEVNETTEKEVERESGAEKGIGKEVEREKGAEKGAESGTGVVAIEVVSALAIGTRVDAIEVVSAPAIDMTVIGAVAETGIAEIGKEKGNRKKIARETVVIVKNLEKKVKSLMHQLIRKSPRPTHYALNLVWLR